jgi:hypothetical protein
MITVAIFRFDLVRAREAALVTFVLDSVSPAAAAPYELNLATARTAKSGNPFKVCYLLLTRTAKIGHAKRLEQQGL